MCTSKPKKPKPPPPIVQAPIQPPPVADQPAEVKIGNKEEGTSSRKKITRRSLKSDALSNTSTKSGLGV